MPENSQQTKLWLQSLIRDTANFMLTAQLHDL